MQCLEKVCGEAGVEVFKKKRGTMGYAPPPPLIVCLVIPSILLFSTKMLHRCISASRRMGRPQGIRTLFQCMAPLLARRLPFLTVPSAQCTDGDVDVYAPYDNKHIASIPSTDAAGIETALTTAYSVFQDRSKWLSTSRRVEILKKLCTLMEERVEELTIEVCICVCVCVSVCACQRQYFARF